ncbi:hypothetical protein BCR39DRAFT_589910 [Naematelia encephala]|uniref:WKF domain-containing protein n=1 Tax=Naematelia encephala TaxID=71784 RepID=A0A1Y2AUH1_9TREE|nr:hypothetical protein BCR39DRAFT_589910 [Naematelia encephala]
MSVEIVKPVETKEERRARKAAKKQAKLESHEASEPGSSSARPSLGASKSEFEVSQILTVEPDVSVSDSKKKKRERAVKEVGDIAGDSESSVKHSKKEKKEKPEKKPESEKAVSSELDERQKRKAEKKALKEQKEVVKATSEAPVDKKEKKRKVKSDLEDQEDGVSKDPKPKKEKKEKSKKAAESLDDKVEPTVSLEQDERKEKKAKKEKRKRDAETEDNVVVPTTIPAAAESSTQHNPSTTDSAKPAKKSKKDKKLTGKYDFTSESIFADTELSEHGQKAIHYAYEHATLGKSEDGKGWKFSKGKQLWLMRHIWDQNEVPEKYVDLVIGYLKTVQGLGRTGLIDTAKKQIAAPEPVQQPVEKVDESTQKTDEKLGETSQLPNEESGELKTDQPRKVMFADSTEEGQEDKPKIAADGENAVEDTAVKRDRAKRMLAAIGAR